MMYIWCIYRQYIDFRVELFIISTDHVLVVYNIGIYLGLIVEFFCNLHEIL